jgi:hypothetical protein
MDDATRRYLAEIGRRGGMRSRRTLSPEQARAMVAAREGRRRQTMAAGAPLLTRCPDLPGADLVAEGLRDLAAHRVSEAALLVSVAAPRLRLLGLPVAAPLDDPEERLFARLTERHGDAAHGRYNALIRRMVSFSRAAALCAR